MAGPSATPLPPTLTASLGDFRDIEGANLVKRIERFYSWQTERQLDGLWPYSRATVRGPRTRCALTDDLGLKSEGVNFGSLDHLGLSRHPTVRLAAHNAIERYGVHSAGAPAFVGGTAHSAALEKKLSEFLAMERTALYPSGFVAGYGAVAGLVRARDHIVIDNLAHACLQQGAAAATRNVYHFRHLDAASARRWLEEIRSKDAANGVLLVTEGLFASESDCPDLGALAALACEFDAVLLVDVANDLGAMGEDGRGQLGIQKALGKADLVVGSFAKALATNGGFVAARSRAVQQYLRSFDPAHRFSNALSPVQAAVALQALEIVAGPEGAARRAALMRNSLLLRARLADAGLKVLGEPSPIVVVRIGSEALARLVGRNLANIGMIANLLEPPLTPRGEARFRLNVMADHSEAEIGEAAKLMQAAVREAEAELADLAAPAAPQWRAIA